MSVKEVQEFVEDEEWKSFAEFPYGMKENSLVWHPAAALLYPPKDAMRLTDSLAEKAMEQLNETEELRDAALKDLSKRLDDNPDTYDEEHEHFFRYRGDEQFLLRFVRKGKMNVDKAETNLLHFIGFENKMGWWDIDEVVCIEWLKKLNLHLMPTSDDHGRALNIVQIDDLDAIMELLDAESTLPMMKASWWLFNRLLKHPAMQVSGLCVVEDLDTYSLALMKKTSTDEMQMSMEMFDNCLPIRLGGTIIMNQPWYFTVIWAIAKQFMSEKMKSRVSLLKDDYDALHELVPKEFLPEAFKGTAEAFDMRGLLDRMLILVKEEKEQNEQDQQQEMHTQEQAENKEQQEGNETLL
eukprot:TRINITY_DN3077_c0_g1_i7.p1 TRINITY_DN3077_c0_g1~~TRINITY_DN3077_c0_g1_i7.p1  ORF type:complete len:353 (-),score=125.96 TRINITY_DN3077_c0_g1_i7:125-1183(-)